MGNMRSFNDEREWNSELIAAIRKYMRYKHLTQTDLALRMDLSQGYISKLLNPNRVNKNKELVPLPYADACNICAAMDSSLPEVLSSYQQNTQYSNKYSPSSTQEYPSQNIILPPDGNLISDINDPLFRKWLGTYHCYFYSTLSTEDVCFHGTMEITPQQDENICHVHFAFTYDDEHELQKEYNGQLFLSRQTRGAYCTLLNNEDQGEASFLVMADPGIKNKKVCCVICMVATISGGKGTNHPCVERMIISRTELSGPKFALAKVHLSLNDKNIRIREGALLDFLSDDRLPASFRKHYLKDGPASGRLLFSEYPVDIMEIPESRIKSFTACTPIEQQMIIDIFRTYDLSPKYNKIKETTAENDVFRMFQKEFEECF